MNNGQLHDDKLFQGLHDRLSDYEAPYNGADWDAMSRSLDKLPKTNTFQWKFSLNTIGIALGIIGLTVVGVVIASGNSKSPKPTESNTVNTVAPSPKDNNTQPVVTMPVVNTAQDPSSTDFTSVTGTEMNSHKDFGNIVNPGKQDMKQSNPFRLGDQIDPTLGVVRDTKEDPALMGSHADMKEPDVYYDIDDKGNVRPIHISHDGDSSAKELKQDSLPQAPANGTPPEAPTSGDRMGFDHT